MSAIFRPVSRRSLPIDSGAVAHLGERFNGIEEVRGSSPRSSTRLDKIKNFYVDRGFGTVRLP